jgi:hypothetical protein
MSGDFAFFVGGGLMLLACLLKLPALIRAQDRDWLLSSVCALLLFGSGVLFTTAPNTIAFVNRGMGISNGAAPLIYILLTGFSGASIVLVLNWRGGRDAAQTRRLSRITIAAYGSVCILIAVLFAAGDAPIEQRTRFDTYYATTPFIREMIVVYLAAHAVAALTVGRLSWRWSREVHGAMRIGLRVLAVAYWMHFAGYDTFMAMAVAGRWSGHNWGILVDVARTMIAPSAVLGAAGFLLPLIGRSSEDAIRYWQLAPLARAVRPVEGVPSPVRLPMTWRKPDMRLRLTQRQTYISDRIVACRGYFSTRVWDEAHAAALARNTKNKEEDAAVIAEAAMIVAAVEAHRATGSEAAPGQSRDEADHRAAYTNDLADIARALRSGIVKRIRTRARSECQRALHTSSTVYDRSNG